MYKEFYRLEQNPFSFTADPLFVFETKSFNEGMVSMLFGIEKMDGIVSITGEIGTGKTTLCNYVVSTITKKKEWKNTHLILTNPFLIDNSMENLFRQVYDSSFGKESIDEVSKDYSREMVSSDGFQRFLTLLAKKGKKIILVIDEADKLSQAMLQNVSFLSNMEQGNKKLLQLILVGEPGLYEKLEEYQLHQLNQRIMARYQLEKLSSTETKDYINHRLKIAGDNGTINFDASAIKKIYHYTSGCQRLINLLCDRILLIGSTQRTMCIDKKIVQKAILSLNINERTSFIQPFFSFPSLVPSAAIAAMILVTVIVWNKDKLVKSLSTYQSAGQPVLPPAQSLTRLASIVTPSSLMQLEKAAEEEVKVEIGFFPGLKKADPSPVNKEVVNNKSEKESLINAVVVKDNRARIRKSPNFIAEIISVVGPGTLLKQVETREKWTMVQLPDSEEHGWIYNTLIKDIASVYEEFAEKSSQ